MRTFEKSHKLDYVCYDIRGPVMDEAQRMIAQGMEILKLNIVEVCSYIFSAYNMYQKSKVVHHRLIIIQYQSFFQLHT